MPTAAALAAATLLTALAACQSDSTATTARPPQPAAAPPAVNVGDLCSYRERKEPIIVVHKDATGNQYFGEVQGKDLEQFRLAWGGASGKNLATAVARPRVDVYRASVEDNCYDAQRRVYYSCRKTISEPVGQIHAFARAPSMPEARALALQVCRKKLDEIVQEKLEIDQENRDKGCRIVAENWCAAPPAPPPKPAPAKKRS
jgi:hypothetical protein